jgi:hypothetical protein
LLFIAWALFAAAGSYFFMALVLAIGLLPAYRKLGNWEKGDGFRIALQVGLVVAATMTFVVLQVAMSGFDLDGEIGLLSAVAAILVVLAGWNLRRQLKAHTGGPMSWMVYTFPFLTYPWMASRPMIVFDALTLGIAFPYLGFVLSTVLD